MIWIICSFTEAMIISYALQQFLFCGSGVHDRDRGAVCPGDRNRSRHVVCHGADGIHAGCTKGPARVGMFYCCTGSDGMIRGCPGPLVRYDVVVEPLFTLQPVLYQESIRPRPGGGAWAHRWLEMPNNRLCLVMWG